MRRAALQYSLLFQKLITQYAKRAKSNYLNNSQNGTCAIVDIVTCLSKYMKLLENSHTTEEKSYYNTAFKYVIVWG